jgi:aminodeoxyfutalosine synthase
MLADEARRRRHGDVTTFVRVQDVPVEEMDSTPLLAAAGEIRIVGDVRRIAGDPDAIGRLVSRANGVPVTAGALEELEALAGESEGLEPLLRSLREAGLSGVAAAALDRLAAPARAVRVASDLGLPVVRFGIQRAPAEPWHVLETVQALHGATGLVRTFAPLAREQDPVEPTTGYADMKTVALARLLLDRVPSIQVDWTLHGPKLAQVALMFGADDLDAVSAENEIGTGRRRAPLEEIRRNIRAASLLPVERDGLFRRRES